MKYELWEGKLPRGYSKLVEKHNYKPHGWGTKPERSSTYQSWYNMLARCYLSNPSSHRYRDRGIRVCIRWVTSFENFLADMGERPSGMTLDREENNGHYTPDNCRWATWAQQNNNRCA